uniref:Uncharacterized protein n=1 Tax=Arundo donax TaxID=35708 RepID=A0A0A9B2M0_ARUDO
MASYLPYTCVIMLFSYFHVLLCPIRTTPQIEGWCRCIPPFNCFIVMIHGTRQIKRLPSKAFTVLPNQIIRCPLFI